jgi:hypothetical protein
MKDITMNKIIHTFQIILLLAVITGSNQVSGVTVFDLGNGKSGFEVHEINGVKILIAPEVTLPPKGTIQKHRLFSNMRRVLKQTEKLMPRTYSEFNRLSYKVYLLHEPHAANRLEFIREGQEKWDRRIPRDGSMSRSIMIFRTLDFSILHMIYFILCMRWRTFIILA